MFRHYGSTKEKDFAIPQRYAPLLQPVEIIRGKHGIMFELRRSCPSASYL